MSSVTTRGLLEMKEKGERIVALTCYDALFARLRERINAVASIAGQNRVEADDVATRAVQAAEGLTDLERATRDLEQVATMLRDLTRGFANVN